MLRTLMRVQNVSQTKNLIRIYCYTMPMILVHSSYVLRAVATGMVVLF